MTAILPLVASLRPQAAPVLGATAHEPATPFAELLDAPASPAGALPEKFDGGEQADWQRTQLFAFVQADAAPPLKIAALPDAATQLAGANTGIAPVPALVAAVAPSPANPAEYLSPVAANNLSATASAGSEAQPLTLAEDVPPARGEIVTAPQGGQTASHAIEAASAAPPTLAKLQPGLLQPLPGRIPIVAVDGHETLPIPPSDPAITRDVTADAALEVNPAAVSSSPIASPVLTAAEPAEPPMLSPVPAALASIRFDGAKFVAHRRASMFDFTQLGMFGEFGAQLAQATAVDAAVEPNAAVQAATLQPAEPPMRIAQRLPIAPASANASIAPPAARPPMHEPVPVAARPQLVHTSEASAAPSAAATPIASLSTAGPMALPQIEASDASFEAAVTATPATSVEPLVVQTPRIAAPQVARALIVADDRAPVLPGSAGLSGKFLPRTPPPAPNPFNLLVGGSQDALAIAVRSAGGEGYATLRRLAQDTAAEFGMDVADFQLNGSASEHGFTSMLGGTRGNRTR